MRNYSTTLALWLCVLVMSIPLASAQSLRNTVNVQSISGADDVNGVRRADDQLQVSALVNVQDGDTSDLANALTISEGLGSAPFTSCTAVGGSAFSCQFTAPASDHRTTAVNYAIQLFPSEPPELQAAASARVEVDNLGPRMTNVQLESSIATGGTVDLTFTATDCLSGTSCTKCAGVESVEIIAAESRQSLLRATIPNPTCTVTQTVAVPISGLPDGVSHLCAIPRDHFGQERAEFRGSGSIPIGGNCEELTKDDSPPEISDFALVYRGTDTPVDFLTDRGTPLAIQVNVRTNLFPLEGDRVRVDLTQLGLAALFVPCAERFAHDYRCEADVQGAITQAGSKSIAVSATDAQGNSATESFSITISLDTDTPSVLDFRTNFVVVKDNTTASVIGKRNNTFIAQLQESGSGFDAENVKVHIADGRSTVLDMTCAGNTCTSEPYQVSGNPASLAATLRGADDTGHQFTLTKTFAVDAADPELIELTIENSNHLPFIVEGDDLRITAKLHDATGMSGQLSSADFRNISTSASPNPTCTNSGTEHTCRWALTDVFPVNQIVGQFTFADAANNRVTMRVDEFPLIFTQNERTVTLPPGIVSIAKNANTSSADFWRPTMEGPMPGFIDDDTAQVVTYRAWWNVGFEPQGSIGTRMVDVEFSPAACEGESFERFVQDIDLLQPDPTHPEEFMLKVTFVRGAIDVEQLQWDCPVRTRTIYNNQLYPEEFDDLVFQIPVTRAGEVSKEVKAEIDRVRNSWLVKASFIGTISKYLTMGKNICNTFAALEGVWTGISTLLTIIGWLDKTPAAAVPKAVGGVTEGGVTAKNKIKNFADKFCRWMTCKTGINKWYTKFVNSHKIGSLESRGGAGSGSATKASSTIWPQDPSQSLILSIVAACIPGIFFNLQKARQIECQYLDCLHSQVASGTPVFVCSKLRNYGWCRYIIGEIFQIIPFAHFFQSFAGTVQALLANPISAFMGISNWMCAHWQSVDTTAHGFCHLIPQLVLLGDALNDIKTLKDTDWKIQKDSCKEVLDKIEEAESGTAASADAAGGAA